LLNCWAASSSIKALLPFVAGLLIAGVTQAQLLPTWETHITLTQQDLDMICEAVTNQVHGKPVRTVADWRSPASGNSGSIKLVKKLSRKNQQCEDIAYTVRSGGTPVYTEHYHFISCLQPDGTWKIV
jgi:surface antigen